MAPEKASGCGASQASGSTKGRRPCMLPVVQNLGRTLLVMGLVMEAIGVGLMLVGKVPWIGQLPGDIHVERDDFSFHFPLVTCLVVSLVLSLILHIFLRR
jgi:DUF2905 family protein